MLCYVTLDSRDLRNTPSRKLRQTFAWLRMAGRRVGSLREGVFRQSRLSSVDIAQH